MSDIEVERRGEVEWIRLNRPDRMNAYDAAMARELIEAVENASDAGVIVLTGTGRAFCAGGYLANLSDPDPEALRSMFYGSLKVYEALRTSPRPVIAAVNERAKEIAFMCRRYPAQEALEMGLINAVVPGEQLEDEVTRWADELLFMSPRYLEIAKISSNVWWNQCRDNYLSGLAMLVQAIGSADMIEGASAFMEKRRPQFQGRSKKS